MTTISENKYQIMKEGGSKLGQILETLFNQAHSGMNLLTIEENACRMISESGGKPSFMTVSGYHWATCLCINEEVVHGIPKDYILKDGDLLTIDIGMLYQGYHTDCAWTKTIGTAQNPQTGSFLDIGKKALSEAIAVAIPGNHIGDISKTIEKRITGASYSIIKTLVGHGVGKKLHEDPQIPGFLNTKIHKTQRIASGMTLAIEIIYAQGKGLIVPDNDGWTLKTRDGSLSAVFEHTIYIGENQTEVLTGHGFWVTI